MLKKHAMTLTLAGVLVFGGVAVASAQGQPGGADQPGRPGMMQGRGERGGMMEGFGERAGMM